MYYMFMQGREHAASVHSKKRIPQQLHVSMTKSLAVQHQQLMPPAIERHTNTTARQVLDQGN